MKIKLFLSVILFVGLVFSAHSQNEPQARWKVTSVGFSLGGSGAGTANSTEDYINLKNAVNNPKLFIDPAKYSVSQYNYGFGGNFSAKAYLGLTPYSKKKGEYNYSTELRFHVGTGMGIRRSFNYYSYDNFTVDTLQSVNGSNTVLADSTLYERYIYQETFNEASFGVSYLFKTPYKRRFQFQAGGMLEYAIAYRTYVNVDNYAEKSLIYYEPGNPPDFNETEYAWNSYSDDLDGTITSETTNLKGSTHFVRGSVPLGVNFRIARKEQSFFNKVYLWLEINPGVEIQIVSNDKTYVNPYFSMALLGITYRW